MGSSKLNEFNLLMLVSVQASGEEFRFQSCRMAGFLIKCAYRWRCMFELSPAAQIRRVAFRNRKLWFNLDAGITEPTF